ncbi:MAG: tetratricopeptide repeat protein [Bifidobacteriaceae bacterium]|nr:tetratricopeptide repeat protein [Bifidobacteriaceae bacterium]
MVARVYAANVVESDNAAMTGPGGEAGGDNPGSDQADTGEATGGQSGEPTGDLPRDMGTRGLPLLSDWAVGQWETGDLEAAVNAAGERVFGDSWAALWAAPEPQSGWESQLFGSAPELPDLDAAISTFSSDQESDLLDLVGILALRAAERPADVLVSESEPYDRAATYALSLARSLEATFGSCDAALTAAHTFSLSQLSDPSEVANAYQSAVSRCGDDPTPGVEVYRLKLATGTWNSDDGEGWAGWRPLASEGDWASVETDLADLVAAFPGVAAAHALAGDGYALLARMTPAGPFTIQHFQDQAVLAYQRAAELSSDPAIGIALAQAQLVAGELAVAQATLDSLPVATDTQQSLAIAAALSASKGDFTAALELADEAVLAAAATGPNLSADPNASCGLTLLYPPAFMTVPSGARLGVMTGGGGCGDGAEVEDLGFVPTTRIDTSYNSPKDGPILDGATTAARIDYAALAGDWPACQELCDSADWRPAVCALAAVQGQVSLASVDEIDAMQDLLRYWGAFDLAENWNEGWTEAMPDSRFAWERLGEVRFLQEDWSGSAEASARAASGYSADAARGGASGMGDLSGPGWAPLRVAAAYRLGGRTGEAREALDQASAEQQRDWQKMGEYDYSLEQNLLLLDMYIQLERGQLAYGEADYEGVVTAMEASIAARDAFRDPVKTGAQEQALSLSNLRLGDYQAALDWANAALEADPFSPLYREAVADAQRSLAGENASDPSETSDEGEGGQTASGSPSAGQESATDGSGGAGIRADLIANYRQAVELDPTLFSSWNNLGVLLAQDGQTDAAASAFKRAIEAVPDYSYAWFNLGALEAGHPGLKAFLLSQGALGRASSLNKSWKDKDPVLLFDDEVYSSGLDVSKPIPEDWHLAQTVRSNPPVLTAGLILILLLRVGKEIGQHLFTERFTQGSLRRAARRQRFASLATPRWPAILTAAVSTAALLWLTGVHGWREAVLVGLGAVVLLGWHGLAPRLLSLGQAVNQRSLPMASLVTAGLAPFGLAFTPPAPLTVQDDSPVALRRAGVSALAILTLSFAAVAAATAVPVARATAVASILVVSSAMIPFAPLDGGRIQAKRWAEIAISLALTAATVAVALAFV